MCTAWLCKRALTIDPLHSRLLLLRLSSCSEHSHFGNWELPTKHKKAVHCQRKSLLYDYNWEGKSARGQSNNANLHHKTRHNKLWIMDQSCSCTPKKVIITVSVIIEISRQPRGMKICIAEVVETTSDTSDNAVQWMYESNKSMTVVFA